MTLTVNINRVKSPEWHQQSDIHRCTVWLWLLLPPDSVRYDFIPFTSLQWSKLVAPQWPLRSVKLSKVFCMLPSTYIPINVSSCLHRLLLLALFLIIHSWISPDPSADIFHSGPAFNLGYWYEYIDNFKIKQFIQDHRIQPFTQDLKKYLIHLFLNF